MVVFFLDISHKHREFIISKIPRIYRQFIETQMLDISKEPMEVAPTAHYSMGGIYVTPGKHSTNVSGLFAAGEVAGGLHLANRLGGNSLAEILIFGQKAGKAASDYSKNLRNHIRSQNEIKKSHENINCKIGNRKELLTPLQYELSEILWKHCGVVKDGVKLTEGLEKLNALKRRSKDVDIRIEDNNYQDLVNSFDLDASIMTAEASILSSLKRKESRGAHQRSDYPEINQNENFNYVIEIKNGELDVLPQKVNALSDDQKKIIKKSKFVRDFKDSLLE